MASGPLLFNFSASYSGGGYKRLFNYARWFDSHGGAVFIIHPKCAVLLSQFPHNRYVVVNANWWYRFWDDRGYLKEVLREFPQPTLYYAYGIPMYSRVAAVNWFHLSNALPVIREHVPMGWVERIKFKLLGRRIRSGLSNAEVIAAESQSSLDLLGREHGDRLFMSSNGFDDGLTSLGQRPTAKRDNIAIIIGTYRYKALGDALLVFDMLRSRNPLLRLRVFGPADLVPRCIRQRADVELAGTQAPVKVIESLKSARFYISTSRIENSSNADLEGAFLAEETWLSDIPPHREMISESNFDLFKLDGVDLPLLRVRGEELQTKALKSWQDVIEEMLARISSNLNSQGTNTLPLYEAHLT